ncbi:uncharacterized protein BKA55DRAFT_567226 [Fusarium redolens]|uniref:Uncharacterized protein n=1 Tax=Fusarium redolens TaxID=48865 RepID=A0A9P9HAX9_FUSRE|nr:uncharacterized protein BKA55DRAFT_567226 [Fusarium redolens]KAH7254223.1 hypothetical protein BKA55DRAFT_567226 [Fusarium redolens]
MPSKIVTSTSYGATCSLASTSVSNQLNAKEESNDRIQIWLLDPGLDLQGRLLTGASPWHSPRAQHQTRRNNSSQNLRRIFEVMNY